MTRDKVIERVQAAFSGRARPEMFIRGTCKCEECCEHEEVMQAFVQDDIPLDKVNNPGWDPICFASDAAFAYLMPGLVRLALDHTDAYVEQFVLHLENEERTAAFSPEQAASLLNVLDFLVLEETEVLDRNMVANGIDRVREKLESVDSEEG